MICGLTGCRKTYFVKRFFRFIDRMSDTAFTRKMLKYSEWQDGYLEYGKDVEFHEGLPQNEDFSSDPRPKLVVIDDLMRESSNNTVIYLRKAVTTKILVLFLSHKTYFIKVRNKEIFRLMLAILLFLKIPEIGLKYNTLLDRFILKTQNFYKMIITMLHLNHMGIYY